jgi:MYXO-CTERM domain-containing protein
MKKLVAGALALAACAGAANAVVIYDSSVQTGFRYNAGQAGATTPADNRRVAFDDVNFADADVGANTHVEITRITVGIRRGAAAPATDVTLYWSTFTTPVVAPDTELDVPYTSIGTVSLPINPAAGFVTELVSMGDGVNPMFTAPLSNLFGGFKSMAIGMNLSSTDPIQGWRITNAPGPNANVFWQHDPFMTGQANPEASFLFSTTTPPNPPATFYIVVEGSFVPTPGAAALLGLGGLVATRRRR